MASFVETILSSLTSQVTGPLSARLGEPESVVRQGAQAGGAALLAGLAGKAGDSGLLGQVFNLAKSAAVNPAIAEGSAVTGLLGSLFPSGQGAVAEAISHSSGMNLGSAATLLAGLVPAFMGVLGSHINSAGMTPASLAGSLTSSAGDLKRFLPAGLSTSLLSGLPVLSAVPNAAHAVTHRVAEVEKSGSKWLWPALFGLIVLGAIIYFLTWRDKGGDAANAMHDGAAATSSAVQQGANATADAAKSAWAATLGAFGNRKLPDGTELNIPANGVENKLIDFIGSSKPVDENTWFDFDRLTFDTGAATLQASSQDQLGDIAKVLAAYPKVKLRVGGYTDNTGNAASNMKLSQDRADTVVAQLTGMGVAAGRLSAKGYGEEHPVADNSTEEGKQKNRRISMRVLEK